MKEEEVTHEVKPSPSLEKQQSQQEVQVYVQFRQPPPPPPEPKTKKKSYFSDSSASSDSDDSDSDSSDDDNDNTEGNHPAFLFLPSSPLNTISITRHIPTAVAHKKNKAPNRKNANKPAEWTATFDHIQVDNSKQPEEETETSHQQRWTRHVAEELVIHGRPCLVAAYGASQTGKTQALFHPSESNPSESSITLALMEHIWDCLQHHAEGGNHQVMLQVSAIEVCHNNNSNTEKKSSSFSSTTRDLLLVDQPQNESSHPTMRVQSSTGRILGCTALSCVSLADVHAVLHHALAHRTASNNKKDETTVLRDSPHSSLILQVHLVQQQQQSNHSSSPKNKSSILHIVDVASCHAHRINLQSNESSSSAAKATTKANEVGTLPLLFQLLGLEFEKAATTTTSRTTPSCCYPTPLTRLILTINPITTPLSTTRSVLEFGQQFQQLQTDDQSKRPVPSNALLQDEPQDAGWKTLVQALALECIRLQNNNNDNSKEPSPPATSSSTRAKPKTLWSLIHQIEQLQQQRQESQTKDSKQPQDDTAETQHSSSFLEHWTLVPRSESMTTTTTTNKDGKALSGDGSSPPPLPPNNSKETKPPSNDDNNDNALVGRLQAQLRTSQFREAEAVVFLRHYHRFYTRTLQQQMAAVVATENSTNTAISTSHILETLLESSSQASTDLFDLEQAMMDSGLLEETPETITRTDAPTATTSASTATTEDASGVLLGDYRPSPMALAQSAKHADRAAEADSVAQIAIRKQRDEEDPTNNTAARTIPPLASLSSSSLSSSVSNRESGDLTEARQKAYRTPAGEYIELREQDLEQTVALLSQNCVQLTTELQTVRAELEAVQHAAAAAAANHSPRSRGNLEEIHTANELLMKSANNLARHKFEIELNQKTDALNALAWKMEDIQTANQLLVQKIKHRDDLIAALQESQVVAQSTPNKKDSAKDPLDDDMDDMSNPLDQTDKPMTSTPLWQLSSSTTTLGLPSGVVLPPLQSRVVVPFCPNPPYRTVFDDSEDNDMEDMSLPGRRHSNGKLALESNTVAWRQLLEAAASLHEEREPTMVADMQVQTDLSGPDLDKAMSTSEHGKPPPKAVAERPKLSELPVRQVTRRGSQSSNISALSSPPGSPIATAGRTTKSKIVGGTTTAPPPPWATSTTTATTNNNNNNNNNSSLKTPPQGNTAPLAPKGLFENKTTNSSSVPQAKPSSYNQAVNQDPVPRPTPPVSSGPKANNNQGAALFGTSSFRGTSGFAAAKEATNHQSNGNQQDMVGALVGKEKMEQRRGSLNFGSSDPYDGVSVLTDDFQDHHHYDTTYNKAFRRNSGNHVVPPQTNTTTTTTNVTPSANKWRSSVLNKSQESTPNPSASSLKTLFSPGRINSPPRRDLLGNPLPPRADSIRDLTKSSPSGEAERGDDELKKKFEALRSRNVEEEVIESSGNAEARDYTRTSFGESLKKQTSNVPETTKAVPSLGSGEVITSTFGRRPFRRNLTVPPEVQNMGSILDSPAPEAKKPTVTSADVTTSRPRGNSIGSRPSNLSENRSISPTSRASRFGSSSTKTDTVAKDLVGGNTAVVKSTEDELKEKFGTIGSRNTDVQVIEASGSAEAKDYTRTKFGESLKRNAEVPDKSVPKLGSGEVITSSFGMPRKPRTNNPSPGISRNSSYSHEHQQPPQKQPASSNQVRARSQSPYGSRLLPPLHTSTKTKKTTAQTREASQTKDIGHQKTEEESFDPATLKSKFAAKAANSKPLLPVSDPSMYKQSSWREKDNDKHTNVMPKTSAGGETKHASETLSTSNSLLTASPQRSQRSLVAASPKGSQRSLVTTSPKGSQRSLDAASPQRSQRSLGRSRSGSRLPKGEGGETKRTPRRNSLQQTDNRCDESRSTVSNSTGTRSREDNKSPAASKSDAPLFQIVNGRLLKNDEDLIKLHKMKKKKKSSRKVSVNSSHHRTNSREHVKKKTRGS